MKSKRLLRFYFNADSLENALDRLIMRYAYKSADGAADGQFYAERILAVIAAKDRLAELWAYLDVVIPALGVENCKALQRYADMRTGINRLSVEERREIKRAVIKLVRHARIIDRFADGIRLVNEYYCLM